LERCYQDLTVILDKLIAENDDPRVEDGSDVIHGLELFRKLENEFRFVNWPPPIVEELQSHGEVRDEHPDEGVDAGVSDNGAVHSKGHHVNYRMRMILLVIIHLSLGKCLIQHL
jgi:hypothetical protein